MVASVNTVEDILAELRAKGNEKTRNIYAKHGMASERVFGVSVADLKLIAKTIKGQQDLALKLYESGYMDAMYLAGMVANGAQMTRGQLNAWADGAAGLHMISEYTVPWVAVESPFGRELAMEWMKSGKDHVAGAGWCTYSGLVTLKPDADLGLKEIEGLLRTVVSEIHEAPNRVKASMNSFVISVGAYVKPLLSQAKAAAEQIGAVSVDMGDTACKISLASASIAAFEASGKVGVKRKMIRC